MPKWHVGGVLAAAAAVACCLCCLLSGSDSAQSEVGGGEQQVTYRLTVTEPDLAHCAGTREQAAATEGPSRLRRDDSGGIGVMPRYAETAKAMSLFCLFVLQVWAADCNLEVLISTGKSLSLWSRGQSIETASRCDGELIGLMAMKGWRR